MIHDKKHTMRAAFAALVATATLLGCTGFTMTATAATSSPSSLSQEEAENAQGSLPSLAEIEKLRQKVQEAEREYRQNQQNLAQARAQFVAAQQALQKALDEIDKSFNHNSESDKKVRQLLQEIQQTLKDLESNNIEENETKLLDAATKAVQELQNIIAFNRTIGDQIGQSLDELNKRLASYAKTIKDFTDAVIQAARNVRKLFDKAQQTLQAWTAALNALSDAFEKWYPAHQYSDVKSTDWFYSAVTEATKRGLMTGYGNGKFGPYDAVTREQAALILYRHAGSPVVVGTLPYKDSGKVSGWTRDAVIWARQNGIMGGYGARNVFGPQDTLTREQAAAIINRDAGNTKASPASAMRWAVDHKVIKGWPDRRGLDPKGRVDRAQMAQILVNAINNKVL